MVKFSDFGTLHKNPAKAGQLLQIVMTNTRILCADGLSIRFAYTLLLVLMMNVLEIQKLLNRCCKPIKL